MPQIKMNFNFSTFPIKYFDLLEYVCDKTITQIITDDAFDLTTSQLLFLNTLIKDAQRGVPIQYLTHKAYFYKDSFYVDSTVLIPRPETEVLVEKSLHFLSHLQNFSYTLVDMCTGSGCIGLTIQKYINQPSKMYLVDISKTALQVCRKNLHQLLPDNPSIHLIQSNLFENFNVQSPIDLIVSNPPYISSKNISDLSYSVRNFEPELALNGGDDGTVIIRRLLTQSAKIISLQGAILLEIEDGQETQLIHFAETLFPTACVKATKDLFDRTRYLEIYL